MSNQLSKLELVDQAHNLNNLKKNITLLIIGCDFDLYEEFMVILVRDLFDLKNHENRIGAF